MHLSGELCRCRQGVVGERHTLRASGRDAACISAVSRQQALPSQAGRSKRAAHPTRVGVMRHFTCGEPCRRRQA
eukprot:scaffold19055_cov48-Phaeocystis_antarctica.AAC.3